MEDGAFTTHATHPLFPARHKVHLAWVRVGVSFKMCSNYRCLVLAGEENIFLLGESKKGLAICIVQLMLGGSLQYIDWTSIQTNK